MNSVNKNEERNAVLHSFGYNLRKIRESKGLTQEEVAYIACFSRSYYTEVEQGKRNLSLLNIYKLAKALNISITQLFS